MAAKRRSTYACRCENKGERWSSKVYRELFEFGKLTPCRPHVCSKIKERLDQHRLSCPGLQADGGQTPKAALASQSRPAPTSQTIRPVPVARPQGNTIDSTDQESSTPRKASIGVSTRRMNPHKRKPRINSVQTSLTFNDLFPFLKKGTEIHSAQTDLTYVSNTECEANQTEAQDDRLYDKKSKLNKTHDAITNPVKQIETREDQPRRNDYSDRKAETVLTESRDDISNFCPMKQSKTHEYQPRRKEYRDQLNEVVREFFHDIPVFPNTSEKIKQKRLRIIVDFVDKIAELFIFIDDEDYYDKLERKIEECLRNLPMWEPKFNQDKLEFKNHLEDRLFTLIKAFNKKWHSFKIKRKENVEKEIINWAQNYLESTTVKGAVNKNLINKIKRILESGINEKHIMRDQIVNILEEISPYLKLPHDKDVNILAGDLTRLLSDSEEKYEISDDYKCTRDKSLNDYQLGGKAEDEIINEITNILFSYDDLDLLSNKWNVVKEIRRILKLSGGFSDSESSSLAKTLVTNVRGCFDEDLYTKNGGRSHSSSFLILSSEQDLSEKSDPLFHSTPENYVRKKEIPTLNKIENVFIEKVSAIVRTWLDTTHVSFEIMEEQAFKETVVDDMTNDIHSIVKQIVQLQVPGVQRIDETALNKIILKAIKKYDLFARPMTGESPQVVDLKRRIMALDTDDLLDKSDFLEPQHGNIQAMANTKFRNGNDMKNMYRPNTLDILEDNISIWMNEQPSDIYKPCDKNKFTREVASNIQKKIIKKSSDNEIKNELKQWLNKIVKPQMQRNVDGLAENLKDRIVKLPHDETLNKVHQKQIDKQNEIIETEDRVNEFVDKHIRKYNIDDDVVNGVLKLMVYRELYKLSRASREELYNNRSNDAFNTGEFRKELEIAREIHDWLKNIPFYYPLLKPGHETIEFVHILARTIANIECERIKYPNKMDYNSWLHTQIETYMLQKEAAIANEDKFKIDHYAGQLYMRIVNLRKDEENSDKLCKIITEHMKKYDTLLAKDYLKKILWRRRLADNVKKLLLAKPTASHVDVEKALAMIPLPQDDSVFKYKMEIKYNITIHDWLHVLPLVPPKDNEEEHRRKNKIQELLQKIVETDERKAGHPNDTQIDDELDSYIASWIFQLQFEEDADINIPVMISQLRSGLEYTKWSEIQPKETLEHGLTVNSRSMYIYMSRQHSTICCPKQKDPGEQMVEVIENWCNNLPIKEKNNEATKAKKEHIAINIFQILGSLNDDSRLANDNLKLKNMLSNEIEEQLENLSQHNKDINKNKEKLKADLINKIMEIKTMMKDITAGDDYVQNLEHSIDASLPINPHHRSPKFDPVYELFKKRMVMLWLLENYDYAVDYHSMKYKKMLSAEVLSLSEEIQNRNLFPGDKDKMMNDIMSAFYMANPPGEDAIVDEIEYIKLRCEIEIWANELPLKEVSNYNKVLERDQILTILSKLLFDIIKRNECDASEKILSEIMKWTQKLPLISGEKINVIKYAELLTCFLKATADSRKCQRQSEPNGLTLVEETLTNLKSDDAVLSKTNQGNKSQIAGPSNPNACGGCVGCGASLEQLAFLMNKAIINWCAQLPLRYGVCNENNVVQSTKVLISQRLFRFVSELNYRPDTLNNEGLYEYHLNLEIEGILTQLANDRAYWEEQRSRNERKYQLINAIKAIRPLVQEVKDGELYKEKLKHTISSFHESMVHSGVELSEKTQMAVLNDFLQYNNHKGDFENQELHRMKINDALKNELNEDVDPLLTANRLICELSKVEFPAQSAKQRRFSEPNPTGFNNLPSAPALRRQSLPPFQNSHPRFVKSQNLIPHEQPNMAFPGPSSYPQRSPLSTSLPAPTCQRPPDFRRSLPLTSEAPPLSQELPVFYRASALDIRPFPLPPPEFNMSDMTNNSHIYPSAVRGPQTFCRGPGNQNFVRDFADQSYNERELIVEHQMPSENTGARIRTTARAGNCPRSSSEYPEERQGVARQEYCDTCDTNDDCAYYMPYPPRMDYMYF